MKEIIGPSDPRLYSCNQFIEHTLGTSVLLVPAIVAGPVMGVALCEPALTRFWDHVRRGAGNSANLVFFDGTDVWLVRNEGGQFVKGSKVT